MYRRAIARIMGNFGISFFSPLVGLDVGNSIYGLGVPFEHVLVIAVLSASFTTGLAISKEAVEFGREKRKN